jgi:hypothetical protein
MPSYLRITCAYPIPDEEKPKLRVADKEAINHVLDLMDKALPMEHFEYLLAENEFTTPHTVEAALQNIKEPVLIRYDKFYAMTMEALTIMTHFSIPMQEELHHHLSNFYLSAITGKSR